MIRALTWGLLGGLAWTAWICLFLAGAYAYRQLSHGAPLW
jgi:hypothetical protein